MYTKGDVIVELDCSILAIVVSVTEHEYKCTRYLQLYLEGLSQFSISKDCRTLKIGSVRGIK